MKKILLIILLTTMLLSACAAPEKELLTVNDAIETLPAGAVKYSISVCLPQGMTEAVSAADADRRIFESDDGTFFVVTEVMKGCSAQDAIRQMTGYAPERLGMICTRTGSLPEYRFSWCANSENGMLTCTGIVAEDDAYCYCLSFCAEEANAKNCEQAREQVMSGFGLYYDEGF